MYTYKLLHTYVITNRDPNGNDLRVRNIHEKRLDKIKCLFEHLLTGFVGFLSQNTHITIKTE